MQIDRLTLLIRRSIFIFIFFTVALVQVSSAQAQGVEAPASTDVSTVQSLFVKAIEIKGNKTISVSAILAKIKTRVGQEYIQSIASDDLKRLYNTGYFSDVRVDHEDHAGGVKVIFYIEEKPVIDKITFSKLRYFSAKTLRKKIKTQEGRFLDNKLLKDDEDTIKELYAKKGLTLVEIETQILKDQTNDKASVHLIIREGYRVRILRINVEGNVQFKNKQLIRVIKTRPKGLFTSGHLNEETLEEDIERIRAFYEQRGFVDVVVQHSLEELPNGFRNINIRVTEGKQYRVGHIAVMGNTIIAEQDILKAMEHIKVDSVFSRDQLGVDIAAIRTLYFDQGYIFADVEDTTSINPDTGKVEIRLDLREGEVAYINKIKIQGNTRTRDIVIRRELRINPGERFDGGKLKRSKERLNNLEYFEDVGYDIEDTDQNDRKDLIVQVKEAKTGSLSFGGGFSTVEQLIGFVEIEQRNFDFTNWPIFTGGGQNLKLRAETGSLRNNLFLSFTEPWMFDYPISGGFDAFRTERSRERDIGYAYSEQRIGGNIRFGKQFSDYLTGRMTYRREAVTIEDLESNVSADLLAEQGTNAVSAIGTTLTWDSTDNLYNPTKGWIIGGGTDIAGSFLGGDKDFYRIEGRTAYYFPFKFKSVLELRLRTGIVDAYGDTKKVPIFERFFAGGARTIRGYNERRVGPLDPITEDPIGGESILIGNVEYTIPLINFVKLAAFIDSGGVWPAISKYGKGDIRTGTGVGLRVKTPIGPINLDYGYPLNDEPGEDTRSGKFYFSVSRGF